VKEEIKAEERAKKVTSACLEKQGHDWVPDHLLACASCIAAAILEAERAGMERAAEIVKEKADALFAWMQSVEIGTEKRKDLSLRAGELYEGERAIRAALVLPGDKETT
jgi:hypothetical protein